MSVEGKGIEGAVPLSPREGVPPPLAQRPGDLASDAVVRNTLEREPEPVTGQSAHHATPQTERQTKLSRVGAKTLLPVDAELLQQWGEVKKLFDEARPDFEALVAEGHAACVQLIPPKHVEDQIGPMRLYVGCSGSGGS